MDFFDKLGKKASEAYKVTADKTGKIAKEAKLRMKISELKGNVEDIYKEIGKAVYENHRIETEEKDIANELEEYCTKIDVLSAEIESNLQECLKLKDKRQCVKCFKEIEKNAKFCPECGAEQPDLVEEEPTEVEAEKPEDVGTETTENEEDA